MLVSGQPKSAVAVAAGVTEEAPYSLLNEDGTIRAGRASEVPALSDVQALALYRALLQVRLVDERMSGLQREGRIGFYMPSTGEEATHVGGAFALEARDWIFPSYREPGVFFWRGYTVAQYVNQLYGNAEDPIKGRQMPVHHSANWLNIVSISSPLGTQIPQATGMAMAARKSGKDDVALVYFGEGATATGQFHVGLNFAGVFKAPVVFFCRNSDGATAGTRQTAARSMAEKARAYGIPGLRVDGHDLLAVIACVQDAVGRARSGAGATLIEAVTERRAPSKAGSLAQHEAAAPSPLKSDVPRDPVELWRRHLEQRKLWTQSLDKRYRQELGDELETAVHAAELLAPPAVETLFDDVFATLTPALEEQKAELLSLPRARGGHGGQ